MVGYESSLVNTALRLLLVYMDDVLNESSAAVCVSAFPVSTSRG